MRVVHVRLEHPQFEEDVLRLVEENPPTSTRQVAQTLHTSQNAVWQVVHDKQLHPYHLQKVHALLEEDSHDEYSLQSGIYNNGAIHRRMLVDPQRNFERA